MSKKYLIFGGLIIIYNLFLYASGDEFFLLETVNSKMRPYKNYKVNFQNINDITLHKIFTIFFDTLSNNSNEIVAADYAIIYSNSYKSFFSISPKIKRECKIKLYVKGKNEINDIIEISNIDYLTFQEAEINKKENENNNLKVLYKYNFLNYYQPVIGTFFTVGLIYLFYNKKY